MLKSVPTQLKAIDRAAFPGIVTKTMRQGTHSARVVEFSTHYWLVTHSHTLALVLALSRTRPDGRQCFKLGQIFRPECCHGRGRKSPRTAVKRRTAPIARRAQPSTLPCSPSGRFCFALILALSGQQRGLASEDPGDSDLRPSFSLRAGFSAATGAASLQLLLRAIGSSARMSCSGGRRTAGWWCWCAGTLTTRGSGSSGMHAAMSTSSCSAERWLELLLYVPRAFASSPCAHRRPAPNSAVYSMLIVIVVPCLRSAAISSP